MDEQKRLNRIWRGLAWLMGGFLRHRFNFEAVSCQTEGPCLVISNHVTTWDPLLLALSFPRKHLHFVSSEHVFRLGIVSKLISYLVAPIPRKKASMGTDTVMMSLKKLRAGGSVCIFAEGDATWDGVSGEVFPATGKMARISGATLITYRLEGGYLSLPRWSHKLRRGKMRGHAVGVYSPEQLKAMKPEDIDSLINRDIYEDAWERQRREPVEYKCKAPAEHMEQGFFLCPNCGRVSEIKSAGGRVFCSCGFERRITALGFFQPPQPFETARDWDIWQYEQIRQGKLDHSGQLFSDGGLRLKEIMADHRETLIGGATIRQFSDRIEIGERAFPLTDIKYMSMLKANTLLFTAEGRYFELRSSKPRCLRKYLALWQDACERQCSEKSTRLGG